MTWRCRSEVGADALRAVALCILVAGVLSSASCQAGEVAGEGASPGLLRFLDTYFRSWSEGDMVGYRSLFHDHASIVAVAGGRIVYSLGPDEFVERQARSQESRPMTERMTSVQAHEDSTAAVARVRWLLTGEDQRMEGIDLFTLMRDASGSWKITHLLFYQTPEKHSP